MIYTAQMFPCRPSRGPPFDAAAVLALIARGLVVQPKLNGDRVILVKDGPVPVLFSRHGGHYTAAELDLGPWQWLQEGTILDGEAWQGRFYPFDVPRLAGEATCSLPCSQRVDLAEELTLRAGMPWIFGTPSAEWLRAGAANAPVWEGVVVKQPGHAYRWERSASGSSTTWYKLKW
jgi:ATP-dependent DNA ligase